MKRSRLIFPKTNKRTCDQKEKPNISNTIERYERRDTGKTLRRNYRNRDSQPKRRGKALFKIKSTIFLMAEADNNQIAVDGMAANTAPFDPSFKKKKKRVVHQDLTDESVDKLADKTGNLAVSDGKCSYVSVLEKKKKHHKKPFETSVLNKESSDGVEGLNANMADNNQNAVKDRVAPDFRDRVSDINCENNLERAGERRFILSSPKLVLEGKRHTVFVNFMDLCKTMQRNPDHVRVYLQAHMGTNGSIDEQQRLVVKGRFQLECFESILGGYVNEYVICMCCSPNSILVKEPPNVLRCEKCGRRIRTSFV